MSERNGRVRQYGGDQRQPKEPFVFRIGGSPEITVHEPDAGTVMDIEEATTSRRVLRLFVGDGWGQLEEHLEREHPDVLVDLARDMSRHFELFDSAPAVNRAERRRRARS